MNNYPDKSLGIIKDENDIKEYHLALLSRRVENLEALVFELLRDRVFYESIEAYTAALNEPSFTPTSIALKGRGERMVWELRQNFPPEKLGWPALEKENPEPDA